MRHPRLIDRLVILNVPHPACFIRECRRPAQLLKSWDMLFVQIPLLPEFLTGLRQARLIARSIRVSSRAPTGFPPEVTDVYRENAVRKGGLTAMVNWYRALLRGGGLKRCRDRGFPKIQSPTLLLWGCADWFFTDQSRLGTEDFVSDLTVRLLPGVSQWVQQEAPEAVNAMLEAWLSGARVPEYSEVASASGVKTR